MIQAASDIPSTLVSDATQRIQQPSQSADFKASLRSASVAGEDKLMQAADQLVSTAFVQPLLSQLRDDPFKSDMFHGGRAEEIFGQQLDTILSERVTSSSNFGISEAVASHLRSASPATSRLTEGVDVRG